MNVGPGTLISTGAPPSLGVKAAWGWFVTPLLSSWSLGSSGMNWVNGSALHWDPDLSCLLHPAVHSDFAETWSPRQADLM